MADYNPQTPNARGQEFQPRSVTYALIDSPQKGVAQRFKASNTTALVNAHFYETNNIGVLSGLGVEIIKDGELIPTVTSTNYLPGTDTGATVTGWETQTNAAVVFGCLSNLSGTNAIRNSAALASTATLPLKFRGSAATLSTATRVTSVTVRVYVLLFNVAGTGTTIDCKGLLNINGTDYVSSNTGTAVRGNSAGHAFDFTWTLDPSTNKPWVSTSADNLWDASNDEFGVRFQNGTLAAESLYVTAMHLIVNTCPENRVAYYYTNGSTPFGTTINGWAEVPFSSAGSMVTGAYYWCHITGLSASPGTYFSVPLSTDPQINLTTSPTQTGEHRGTIQTILGSQGGVITSNTAITSAHMPLLLDDGAIANQSTAYVDLTAREAAEKIGGITLTGASGTYVSATDSAPISLTGDQELAALVAPAGLTNVQTIIGKWLTTGNQRGIKLELLTNGTLSLWNSTNGTSTGSNYTSSATLMSVGWTNGQSIWVSAGLDVQVSTNQRTCTFYVSSNADPTANSAWKTLGTAKTSIGFTAVADTTAALEVGSEDNGTVQRLTGNVYRATLYSVLDRTLPVADGIFYARDDRANTLTAQLTHTTISDGLGNAWMLNGAAAFRRYSFAQSITTAAATGYGGVRVSPAWNGSLIPDAPLIVDIRSDTAGATGGGTLLATATLDPALVTNPSGIKIDVVFSTTYTNTANAQVWANFSSSATRGRGWKLFAADTGSDKIASGTLLTEIEGTSHQGGTDQWANETGIPQNRYDLPVALISGLSVPTSQTAITVTTLSAA